MKKFLITFPVNHKFNGRTILIESKTKKAALGILNRNGVNHYSSIHNIENKDLGFLEKWGFTLVKYEDLAK